MYVILLTVYKLRTHTLSAPLPLKPACMYLLVDTPNTQDIACNYIGQCLLFAVYLIYLIHATFQILDQLVRSDKI